MWSALAASWTERVSSSVAGLHDAPEQLLRARLRERHLARGELVQHGLLALHPDRAQPAIGERQREWQADTAEADDGDARFHPRESTCAGSGTGAQTPARSAG